MASPSLISIIACAPASRATVPSLTRGCGSQRSFQNRLSPVRPKMALPRVPVTQMISPGFAPPLLTGSPSLMIPTPVETMVSSECASRSPPAYTAPYVSQQACAPRTISARRSSVSRPMASTICRGSAPIAAISDMVTATDIHPICHPVIPGGKSERS